jgi:hypothetical protein
MELALNLAWLLLAIVLVRLWTVHGPRCGAGRRMQVAALAMLLLILFPVISATDDLIAAQNPAEVESTVRRDHAGNPHSILTIPFALPPSPVSFSLPAAHCSGLAPGPVDFTVACVALAPIQNRPPPFSSFPPLYV